jgi:hypothetical protein
LHRCTRLNHLTESVPIDPVHPIIF